MGGGFLAGAEVNHLRMGRLLSVPEILGDDVAHPGNLRELVAHLGDGQVEVLRANQENVVRRAIPDGAQEARDEFDEAAGLLELLVLLEERDDVLQAWMERVGRGDLVGDRFRTTIGDFGFGGFLQFLAVGVGDVVDLGLSGQGFKRRLRRMS